jgi:hypothetical protein
MSVISVTAQANQGHDFKSVTFYNPLLFCFVTGKLISGDLLFMSCPFIGSHLNMLFNSDNRPVL